jgi:hypothetical protein
MVPTRYMTYFTYVNHELCLEMVGLTEISKLPDALVRVFEDIREPILKFAMMIFA